MVELKKGDYEIKSTWLCPKGHKNVEKNYGHLECYDCNERYDLHLCKRLIWFKQDDILCLIDKLKSELGGECDDEVNGVFEPLFLHPYEVSYKES